ncbi:hypothetical protein Pan265_21490 [Mucisphaera calidilacus]|uniref:Uncharacterized protein n=2 Tax=Mucisphaera calidilacus TaxID=2527982 RepID=A0A518BZ99_9BACT|nr:hypothetical protein Pan265_21490 [Mucisphaera calidilacus]
MICPNLKCRSVLSVPDHARGKKVRCKSCGMRIGVPMPSSNNPVEGEALEKEPQQAKSG